MRFEGGVLLVLPLAAAGCFGSSSGGGPPGTNFDAGFDGSFSDSSVPEEAGADAPGVMDASSDAPASMQDAASEAGGAGLLVRVTNIGGLEPGVQVIVQDSSGNVVTSGTTDMTGTFVDPSVAANSQVTLLFGSAMTSNLLTVQGIEPGDVLPIYDPTLPAGVTYTAMIDAVPANAPAGTASYQAWAGDCTFSVVPGGTTNLLLPSTSGGPPCMNAGNFPVVVGAYGGADAGNAVLGYASQAVNQVSTDGGVTHVTVGGGWSTAFPMANVTAINWPDGGSSVYYGGELAISQVAGGVLTFPASTDLQATGPSGPLTQTLWSGYGDSVQAEAYVFGPAGSGIALSDIGSRSAADAGVAPMDMSTTLPLIQTASLDSTTNPAQPTVTIGTDAGSLSSADGSIVYLSWSTGNSLGQWTIVAPPSASTVQAPALPASVSAWGPTSGSSFGLPIIAVVEATFISGYAELRTQASALPATPGLLDGYPHEAMLPALPVDGTLRMTAYTVNGD